MLTQVQIEAEIERLSALLEQATDEYAANLSKQAEAEVNYKRKQAHGVIAHANSSALGQTRLTATERDARLFLQHQEEYATLKILTALVESLKEAMRTYRHQLDALRTLAANVRAQT